MGQLGDVAIIAAVAAPIAAYAINFGGFRDWLNSQGVFGSGGPVQLPGGPPTTTASCTQLCARRECSTYFNKCGKSGCANCNCQKMCSAAQCQDYKTAGCNLADCKTCLSQFGLSTPVSSNCRVVTDPKSGQKYAIWKGRGCVGGYLRDNLEVAVAGTDCNKARSEFLRLRACPGNRAVTLSYLSSYDASYNPTENRVSIA